MNKVIMMGRLTKDPETRYTADQKAVASFTLAVEKLDKERTADFFDCTAWGKTAELVQKYWKKGMKALITGRLENQSWTTKEGQKRTATKINVNEIEFCEKKTEEKPEEKFVEVGSDEDLPFKF